MSSKFTTPLLFSSVIALGTLGFVACGESGEGGPIQPPGPQSSSSSAWVPPDTTENTAILFTNLEITSQSLNYVKFDGVLRLELNDSSSVEDMDAAHFTKVTVNVVNVATGAMMGSAEFRDEQGNSIGNVLDVDALGRTTVDLGAYALQTNLDDPGYSTCGQFKLMIYAEATDGYLDSKSLDSIPFTRPDTKCQIPESSSSSEAAPTNPLDTMTILFSTAYGKCINMATGEITQTETGDICFTRVDSKGKVNVSSATDIKFAIYDNLSREPKSDDWGREWLPEDDHAQPTTDDFLYQESALQPTITDITKAGDVFFVAIAPNYQPSTGVGFYAFVILKNTTPDGNGDVELTLHFYKK